MKTLYKLIVVLEPVAGAAGVPELKAERTMDEETALKNGYGQIDSMRAQFTECLIELTGMMIKTESHPGFRGMNITIEFEYPAGITVVDSEFVPRTDFALTLELRSKRGPYSAFETLRRRMKCEAFRLALARTLIDNHPAPAVMDSTYRAD